MKEIIRIKVYHDDAKGGMGASGPLHSFRNNRILSINAQPYCEEMKQKFVKRKTPPKCLETSEDPGRADRLQRTNALYENAKGYGERSDK